MLLEFKLNRATKRHNAVVVLAQLCVINTQGDQLTTIIALICLTLLTLLRMLHNSLELHTFGKSAIGVATMHSVYKRLYINLNNRFGRHLLIGLAGVSLLRVLTRLLTRLTRQ